MKNISNLDISSDKCTKCPTCNKASWYIMECDCGHTFCKHCSTAKNEDNSEMITLECFKCKRFKLFV